VVFGYSMGGMIAQELAHRHPDRVAGVVLAATAARPVWSDVAFRTVLLLGRTIARVSRKEFSTVSTRVLVRAGAIAPEHARWMWEGLMRRDANLYFLAGDAVRRFDSRPWIGSLAMSAMVVVNADDQLMPPAMQWGLASYFDDDAVVALEGARHESIMNRADEHAKLINEFVDSLAPA
jgi:3-oxoadipate enol-lactonase